MHQWERWECQSHTIGHTGCNNNGQHTCKTKRMKRNIKSIFILFRLRCYLLSPSLFYHHFVFSSLLILEMIWRWKPTKFASDELSKQVTFSNRISDNRLRPILRCSFFFSIKHSSSFDRRVKIEITFFQHYKKHWLN